MATQTRWIATFIIILIFGALACQACSRIGDDSGAQEDSTAVTAEEASDANQDDAATDSSGTDEDRTGTDLDTDADSDADSNQSASDDGDGEQQETEPAVEPTLIPTSEPSQESSGGSAEETGEDVTEDDGDSAESDTGDSGDGSADSENSDSGDGGSTLASGPSQTACDHPYLPLRLGSTWTYDNDGEILNWEVIDVQGDQNNATAVLRITSGDITVGTNWTCSAEEGLSSYNFADYGFGDLGADMTIELISADGSFLLPADQLVPGATWDLNMESTINFSQEAAGETLEVTGSMTNDQNNEVVGLDPVEFDGQTVDGIQVQQANLINLVLNVLGTSTEQDVSASNSYNLGKGIGIINQTSVTDFGTSTLQLISYNIP